MIDYLTVQGFKPTIKWLDNEAPARLKKINKENTKNISLQDCAAQTDNPQCNYGTDCYRKIPQHLIYCYQSTEKKYVRTHIKLGTI